MIKLTNEKVIIVEPKQGLKKIKALYELLHVTTPE